MSLAAIPAWVSEENAVAAYRAQVELKWPSSRCLVGGVDRGSKEAQYAIFIGPRTNGRRRKSDWCFSEKDAWKNAATKLERKGINSQ